MAVPKKRTSKMKKNTRKSVWRKKTSSQACKALALGKTLLNKPFVEESQKPKGFIRNSNLTP